MSAGPEVKNIVLAHGGFVDGSGWQGVLEALHYVEIKHA
jgi:hypothetical protein